MDWKNLIAELIAHGMTQVEVASRCGCKQTTISELSRGITSEPRYALGEKLKRLHADKKRAASRAKAAATA
jgi:transcriptional regulator with XRE-family HTH domain